MAFGRDVDLLNALPLRRPRRSTSDPWNQVAYFTLAPHLVRRSDVPARVGRGSADIIPAILLARLALSRDLHGQPERWGTMLLLDALAVAVDAIGRVGGRLIVVDAIDADARRFYEHHGFVAAPTSGGRLLLKASDAAKALGTGLR